MEISGRLPHLYRFYKGSQLNLSYFYLKGGAGLSSQEILTDYSMQCHIQDDNQGNFSMTQTSSSFHHFKIEVRLH
jgi:hypothetical protein